MEVYFLFLLSCLLAYKSVTHQPRGREKCDGSAARRDNASTRGEKTPQAFCIHVRLGAVSSASTQMVVTHGIAACVIEATLEMFLSQRT